jgi:hypothetical protein
MPCAAMSNDLKDLIGCLMNEKKRAPGVPSQGRITTRLIVSTEQSETTAPPPYLIGNVEYLSACVRVTDTQGVLHVR